jgi:soluble lytic murein transglycosylase
MPAKVPTYDSFTVTPGITPGVRAEGGISEGAATLPGRQMQHLGEQEMQAAGVRADIADDQLQQANELRVDDALNKVRQKAMDLTYDPQAGYQNLKGVQALDRPGGLPLQEEYGGKLSQSSGEIADGLSNDAQKRMYNMRANDIITGFKGDVDNHMLGEWRTFHGSVQDGNLKLSLQDAQANWHNPAKIDIAINGMVDPETGKRFGGIKQSIYAKGQITGMSADELQANMNDAVSGVHASVVQSAIENSSLDYANDYMSKNKGQMLAPDLLKVQGMLNTKNDANTAVKAATDSTTKYQSAFAPTDMDRLTGIVLQQESGGKRYGGAGSVAGPDGITTSVTGAKGEMQVLDSTSKDPGFGVKPAQDDSPDERARVGKDYLAALVSYYGSPAKALGAYKDGPGNLEQAEIKAAKAGDINQWVNYLSPAGQAYVNDGMKKYNAGVGAPQPPSKIEFVNDAIERLGANPRVEALNATREQATKQYEMLIQQKKDQGDQALQAAQQELIANGGNFTQLSPTTVANLSRFDPAKYDDAQKFAKSISDDNKPTNLAAYAQAQLHPEELAAMPEATFTQFLATNFSKSDQDKIITLRKGVQSGTSDESANSLNGTFIKSTLENRLTNMGIDPNPAKADHGYDNKMQRLGGIQKFVNDDLFAQQKALGRKMNPKEIQDRIDQLFSYNAQAKGFFGGDKQVSLATLDVSDIPGPLRASIRTKLTNRYGTPASDALVLEYYKKAFVNKASTLGHSPTNDELTSGG